MTDTEATPTGKATKEKNQMDPRIRIAIWAVLGFLGWTATCVLVFIGFGAFLEGIGWSATGAGMVSILLFLLVWIGVPVIGGGVFAWADEHFEERRIEEARRQERIAKDEVQRHIKAQVWNDGYQAGGSFWRRKFSDEPELNERDAPANPYSRKGASRV